jgi:NAD(P)-dependent dehydrogenase (short-subunit alcohol dehydrogenase family)
MTDSEKTVLLLGGYGAAGLAIVRLLLSETDFRLIVAGRNEDRARQAASNLNADHTDDRVVGMRADAAGDSSDLESASQRSDLASFKLRASYGHRFTGVRGGPSGRSRLAQPEP